MSESQALFDYSPGHISAVEAAMSIDRLQRYIAESGGDKEKGLRRYERNSRLSEAFYTPLQGVEIVIRNALHKQLLKQFGDKWFDEIDKQGILDPDREAHTPGTLLKLRDAREVLRKKGKPETASRLVAELSFGFWVAICARRYQATLWNPCLCRPFKGLGMPRAVIFERLDHIRNFRNRIAHHEPILSRNLSEDFEKIIETIRWICGASATWVESVSCFRERYDPPKGAIVVAPP